MPLKIRRYKMNDQPRTRENGLEVSARGVESRNRSLGSKVYHGIGTAAMLIAGAVDQLFDTFEYILGDPIDKQNGNDYSI
jgi:hypothetical protein